MIIQDRASGKRASATIANFLAQLLPLDNRTYEPEEVSELVKAVEEEKEALQKERTNWLDNLKRLKAVPDTDFFLSTGTLKAMNVEEIIESDSKKVRVSTYVVNDKKLLSSFRFRKGSKNNFTLKLITPDLIEYLMSVRRFYQKAIQVCDTTIRFLNNADKGLQVNGCDKNSND